MNAPAPTLDIRDAVAADAEALADLINAIIAKGGTTALQDPYTPAALGRAYLTGPDVHCCFVAVDTSTGRIEGFQTLGRYPASPQDTGDIGTFARLGGTQRGVGTALFAATRTRAAERGLTTIHAMIRADNTGGLAYYTKQGFIDHDVIKAVPLKDGTTVDRIVKHYALPKAKAD